MYIYDKANELAALIRESDEYKQFKSLKDELYEVDTTKKMLRDYKKMQFEAQAIYLSGKEVPAETMDRIKKMGEVLQFNPKITEFFTAEYRFNTLISDLYKIIGDACEIDMELFQE
ncbi:MAG: YlbF family regulator [Eubacteriales bacterium]